MFDIRFPHLGITIQHLKNSIDIIPGFPITFYGLIIGLAVVIALFIVWSDARRRGQKEDLYTDFAIFGIIFGLIGSRLYYVLFQWDYYSMYPAEILNIRGGGLAIYGAVIAAFATLIVYCKVKKQSFFSMADTLVLGLILAQAMGRWGNFFNCEAFGGYTDSLFAMQIRLGLVSSGMVDDNVLSHLVYEGSTAYIQVHPTFLYESAWNLALFILLMIRRHHKKFDGELMWLYVGGYGFGRMLIEGLRTDSLMISGTNIRVSQLVAALCFAAGVVMLFIGYKKAAKKKAEEADETGEKPKEDAAGAEAEEEAAEAGEEPEEDAAEAEEAKAAETGEEPEEDAAGAEAEEEAAETEAKS